MLEKALLIQNRKFEVEGFIVQIRIWRLPRMTLERPHGLKYSLFFGRPGERIICYDNKAGKGDHRHRQNVQDAYEFSTMETLLRDFFDDIRKEMEHE